MAHIRFLTCASLDDYFPSDRYPLLTADDVFLLDELQARGHHVTPLVWTSEEARAPEGDLILIRSPWDYFERRDELFAWLDLMKAGNYPLANSARLVRWNLEKTYLFDLEAAGAAVVPSRKLARNSTFNLKQWQQELGSEEIVVKPVIGANAFMTYRINTKNYSQLKANIEELIEQQNVLVQPFLPEIISDGEWSLVFFGGVFSHGFLKRAAPGDFRIQEEHGGSTHALPIPGDIIGPATAAVAAAEAASGGNEDGAPPWYARADGVRTKDGFLIMEVEMFEPELYFRAGNGAAARMADVIEARL